MGARTQEAQREKRVTRPHRHTDTHAHKRTHKWQDGTAHTKRGGRKKPVMVNKGGKKKKGKTPPNAKRDG